MDGDVSLKKSVSDVVYLTPDSISWALPKLDEDVPNDKESVWSSVDIVNVTVIAVRPLTPYVE